MGFGQRGQRGDSDKGFYKRGRSVAVTPGLSLCSQACNRRRPHTVAHDLEESQGSAGVGTEPQLTLSLGKEKELFFKRSKYPWI